MNLTPSHFHLWKGTSHYLYIKNQEVGIALKNTLSASIKNAFYLVRAAFTKDF